MQQAFVSDFDGVIPAFGKPAQETIQRFDEFATTLPIAGVEVREFKDDRTNLLAITAP